MKKEKEDSIGKPISTGKMSPHWDKVTWGADGKELPKKTDKEKELDEFIKKSRAVEEKMDDDNEDLYCGNWKNRKKEVKK